MSTHPPDVFTAAEVAALLRVDATTVRKWIADGKVRAITTPTGRRRIPAGEVERLTRAQGGAA